jgi:hypothetical protein
MIRDLIGQTFGRLRVLARADNTRHGKARYYCSCQCGRATVVVGVDLTQGHTKSCGCWRVEHPSLAFTRHGMRRSAEYRIWCHLKTRCLNPQSGFYYRYGGRGITICPAWVSSFETFYRDMGPRPTAEHSIDRINNDAGYTPQNCRWATRSQQSSNRSTVRHIEHNGITDTLAGWARRLGLPYMRVRRRLIDGWSVERAFSRLGEV